MRIYKLNKKQPEFNQRLREDVIRLLKFMLASIIIFLVIMLIKKGDSIFDDPVFLITSFLVYFILFLRWSIFFSRKTNRFLIRKLSFDDNQLFVEYDEYMDTKQLKYPLNEAKIKLIQWYHTNSIYLKISTDESMIKQYRGIGWSADQLREIFTALKEAQKRLEIEQN